MRAKVKLELFSTCAAGNDDICNFIQRLYRNDDFEVEFNDMHTILKGDYHIIMDNIAKELLKSYRESGNPSYCMRTEVFFEGI